MMKEQSNDYILRTQGRITVVRLRPENLLGFLDVNRIQERLGGLIEEGHRHMVIDLKYVRHAGSAALGMLIALNQLIKSKDGQLVLSHTEFIEPLLEASRTRKLFTIAEDPHEGVRLLQS
jgi:anti-anti-sigma factor